MINLLLGPFSVIWEKSALEVRRKRFAKKETFLDFCPLNPWSLMAAHVRLEVATQDLSNHSTRQVVKVRPGTVVNIKGSEKLFGNTCTFLFSASFSSHWPGTRTSLCPGAGGQLRTWLSWNGDYLKWWLAWWSLLWSPRSKWMTLHCKAVQDLWRLMCQPAIMSIMAIIDKLWQPWWFIILTISTSMFRPRPASSATFVITITIDQIKFAS